jgi:hypothetical protein
MPNEKKNAGKKKSLLSVEETNAMLAKELADDALKEQGSTPNSAEPKALEEPRPKIVSEEDQVSSSASTELGLGQMVAPCTSRKEASSLLILTNRMRPLKNS